ncbi:hypothetical protein ACFSHQ_19995 [Gemmobacter lanyuensis]
MNQKPRYQPQNAAPIPSAGVPDAVTASVIAAGKRVSAAPKALSRPP